jgi:hypothetical protein
VDFRRIEVSRDTPSLNPINDIVRESAEILESAQSTYAHINWIQPNPALLREAAMWFLLLAEEQDATTRTLTPEQWREDRHRDLVLRVERIEDHLDIH